MELTGKTLVFTDCHFGIRNNSIARLNILISVFKSIIKTVKQESISNVIFCGDAFHERVSINSNTLNVALKCFSSLAKISKVYLIVGNHDLYSKNTTDISSVNVFKDTPNITIIDKPMECTINGQLALFVPWLSDLSQFGNSYDLLFGHFDISSQYLIKSYIEQHQSKVLEASSELQSIIDNDLLIASTDDIVDTPKVEKLISSLKKSDDYIGNFIDHLKPGGICYSGHIHGHREASVKNRILIYVGSPFQTTWAERNTPCGYYILDEKNSRTFYETPNVPKHIEIKISEILQQGIDQFDFSIVSGNIIKKIYDKEIDNIMEFKIQQKINDRKPYEELISEYAISISSVLAESDISDQAKMINKSKLDYIRNYIDKIDYQVLSEKKLDREILYKYLKTYYQKTAELLNH